jgi:hypothetical protein
MTITLKAIQKRALALATDTSKIERRADRVTVWVSDAGEFNEEGDFVSEAATIAAALGSEFNICAVGNGSKFDLIIGTVDSGNPCDKGTRCHY